MSFDESAFPLDFLAELLLGRQIEHVFGSENLFAVLQHGVFRHRFVLFRATNQPDGRVVVFWGCSIGRPMGDLLEFHGEWK